MHCETHVGGHCKRKQFHLKHLVIPTNLQQTYSKPTWTLHWSQSKAWKVAAIRSASRVTNAALRSIILPCRTLYLHLYQKPGLRPVYLAEKSVKYEDLPGHAFCQQLPLERCFAGRFSCSASASGPKPQGHVDVDSCGWEELTGSHLGLGEDGGELESWRCLMTYRQYVVLLFPDQDTNQDTPLTRAFCGDCVEKDIMDAARVYEPLAGG